ncbi:MAG: single-stranded DNA-binding protein [bacterium]|nr:single-stranded DNA-binding protein [bacterium]
MAGYNRIILIGNLTRDPEYKQLTSGQAVCRLGLATNRQFKNRQTGNLIQEVCYIDIDVWGAQAESCHQYLQKGRGVLIEGRLKFDTWEDANGQTRSKHSVVADRVVFLNAANDQVQTGSEAGVDQQKTQENMPKGQNMQAAVRTAGIKEKKAPEPESELEKDLLDQIERIKERTKGVKKEVSVKQAAAQSVTDQVTGEMDFKDEPPFEDDLPF